MPQGTVIAIRPISKRKENEDISEEELLHRGCEGEVEILDGDHKGEEGYFNQTGRCCSKRPGQKVDLEILEVGKRILVKLINCDR